MDSKDFYILKNLYKKYGFEKVYIILEHINNIAEIKKKK
ncbi:hypothetical protein SMSRO_SF030850 [Spiroplasma poulsonii]|uniref:Uncharacterized protein n=1 Tax=Spiroplasma poulsonii TaxID=2138 RepID=A0A2P6F8C3_9MOLU|nr:hypothetical protein SMSRO_SF030850 [Spiroplasma poulsonii]